MIQKIIDFIIGLFIKQKPQAEALEKKAEELKEVIEDLENEKPKSLDKEIAYWDFDDDEGKIE
tara:strand:+ start:588 stop:776 length:189 start_codon:yes stop_codon:yes gene_type:complete